MISTVRCLAALIALSGIASVFSGPVVSSLRAATDSTISIGCSDVTENTYVLLLEWRCRGECAKRGEQTLVKFTRGRGSGSERDPRYSLNQETFDLTVTGVRLEDAGEYFCLVNNKLEGQDVVRLTVVAPPDPPSRPLVTGFTSRTVTLTWSSPRPSKHSPGPVTDYVVTISTKGVNEEDSAEFRMSSVGPLHTNSSQTRLKVSGLEPYTVYAFVVQAVSEVGQSRPSKQSYPAITLMEKPSGKPTVLAAHNTSSTSIYLEWSPPPQTSLHGQFLGYVITFRPRDTSPAQSREVQVTNPSATSHTVTDLAVYTQYLLSIRVSNPEGEGPETIVVVMTDEGAPSSPRNVKILSVQASSIQLSWWEPARPNGVIQGYRVYFQQNNLTSVQQVDQNKSSITDTLTLLKPYTRYKIWIRAFTDKHEGVPSEEMMIWTDVQAPGPPEIVSLTCQSGNTMFVRWVRPEVFFRTVDVYSVHYRARQEAGLEREWEQQLVETVNNTINHMMYINNLTTNTAYEVRVRASTQSLVGKKSDHLGPWSDTRAVFLQPGCENIQQFVPARTEDRIILLNLEEHLGMIAGIICGVLGLLSLVLAILLCRRYNQDRGRHYDEKYFPHSSPTLDKRMDLPGWDSGVGDDALHAIPVQLFSKHVMDLHMNQEVGFAKEYEEIRAASCLEEFAAQETQNPDNMERNRYPNIVAFDHTRVRVKGSSQHGGKEKDEYFNANFVDGFRRSKAYIATQGPMQSTQNLFWRMVFEQNVKIIVMITHLYEGGKIKCDQYWPETGTANYGDINVTTVREDVLAFYTLRTFSLEVVSSPPVKKKKGGVDVGVVSRTVYQYHYTAWPDHGVPLHALPLISFIRNSAAANGEEEPPVVVHCSAGVGRTGCYITIHAMLQQIIARGDLDIFSYLQHIRKQRNGLVQTEEQYVFIHDALVEAIEAGETHITKSCLPKYIHSLQCIDVTDEKPNPCKVLEKQYKLVCSYHAGKTQYSTALRICNQSKNRSPDLLPTDSHRVFLSPNDDNEGADYINASWLTGFYNRKGFILSQHPLDSTISSMWQMVAEQEVQVLVVLTNLDNQDYRPFWPDRPGTSMMWDCGYSQFNVSLLSQDDFLPRTIRLRLESNNLARDLVVVQANNWPQQSSPLSTVFDLIKLVDEEQLKMTGGSRETPILVMDRNGGSQASSFCCLMSLWHQLEFEGCVDVFQLSRLYNYSRPGVWRSQEDYLFLYCALEAFITNNGTTIPSPVDLEQWKNGFQLNGCVRVSKVYTDSVGESVNKVWDGIGLTDSFRIPPDGMESASLLKNENTGDTGQIS